ncbi:MAG: hypothetical protein AAFO82_01600, partial [Bacteroidota bacterium]
MKRLLSFTFFTIILFISQAQNIDGIWQGILLHDSCRDTTQAQGVAYAFSLVIETNGNDITGSARSQLNDSDTYSVRTLANISYENNMFTATTDEFIERNRPNFRWCTIEMNLSYDENDNKLEGTFDWVGPPDPYSPNLSSCCPGTVLLFRLDVLSPLVYCTNEEINLEVTGENVKWYADVTLDTMLAEGNTFSPNITDTTTYYITQTNIETQTESPAYPIKVVVQGPILNQITSSPSNCDQQNGSVEIDASSQTGNLEYSINGTDFQMESTFNNVGSGSYEVTIKDESGCSFSGLIEVGQSDPPNIDLLSLKETTCNQDNGSLEVIAIDGTAPYEFSKDGDFFQDTSLFTQLQATQYEVIVRDSTGCTDTLEVNLPAIAPAQISEINILPVECGMMNQSFNVVIDEREEVEYSLGGIDYQAESQFDNIDMGDYWIFIKDQNTCIDSQLIQIEALELLTINNINISSATCEQANAVLTIDGIGGTGVLEYSLDGGIYQSSNVFSNLEAGTYKVYIRDEGECVVSEEAIIEGSSKIVIQNIETKKAICGLNNGSVSVDIIGGVKPLEMYVDKQLAITDFSKTDLQPGGHTLSLVDALGCQSVLEKSVIASCLS